MTCKETPVTVKTLYITLCHCNIHLFRSRLTEPRYFSRDTNLPLLFTTLKVYKSFCLLSVRLNKVINTASALGSIFTVKLPTQQRGNFSNSWGSPLRSVRQVTTERRRTLPGPPVTYKIKVLLTSLSFCCYKFRYKMKLKKMKTWVNQNYERKMFPLNFLNFKRIDKGLLSGKSWNSKYSNFD